MRWLYWAAGGLGVAGVIGMVLGLKGAGVFEPHDALVTGIEPPNHTPQDLLAAVAAIDPEHNPTLQRGYLGQPNWCNRFVHLMADYLGVPLVWGEYGTRANDMIDWIDAGNSGWFQSPNVDNAQALALQGYFVVATYRTLMPWDSGHLAVVLPYPGAVQIAQAGKSNFNRGSVARGFGSIQPIYYAHA